MEPQMILANAARDKITLFFIFHGASGHLQDSGRTTYNATGNLFLIIILKYQLKHATYPIFEFSIVIYADNNTNFRDKFNTSPRVHQHLQVDETLGIIIRRSYLDYSKLFDLSTNRIEQLICFQILLERFADEINKKRGYCVLQIFPIFNYLL